METVALLAVLVIIAWIVIVARKQSTRPRQPRFIPLPDETRAEILVDLADGRLPSTTETHLALRRGEVAHLELEAELMKEVIDREYRGGHRGVSFRIARGVRYYTGSSRGKMVTVGSHLEAADRGQLAVTSQRVVFTGLRRTIEIPHKRIVKIVQMLNGIQFHASNRVNPPLFRVAEPDAELLASVLDVAHQRALAASDTP